MMRGEQISRDVTDHVGCPECGKPAGEPCFREEDGILPPPHTARFIAFRKTPPEGYFEQLGANVIRGPW